MKKAKEKLLKRKRERKIESILNSFEFLILEKVTLNKKFVFYILNNFKN